MTDVRSTRPAGEALPQVLPSFVPVLDLLAEAMRRRKIRRSHGRMSVAQLRDIGLTRHDVELALSLPLENSAEDALAQAAAREAARW